MVYERRNQGTCSVMTHVELNEDPYHPVRLGHGRLQRQPQSICKLLAGMKAEDAIARMKGTTCGSRPTSCPDQISRALEEALAAMG